MVKLPSRVTVSPVMKSFVTGNLDHLGDIFGVQALPNSRRATGNQARRSLAPLCQANRLQRLGA
jgi:hypothetical protein